MQEIAVGSGQMEQACKRMPRRHTSKSRGGGGGVEREREDTEPKLSWEERGPAKDGAGELCLTLLG